MGIPKLLFHQTNCNGKINLKWSAIKRILVKWLLKVTHGIK